MNGRQSFEFDLGVEHHRSFARGALSVRHDRVRGHRQNQRRELGMTDDADVIRLRRAASFDGQLDRNRFRASADRSHDSAGSILTKRPDDCAGVGHLERCGQTRHHGDDVGLRHREIDLADVEEWMAERIDAIAVDVRDGSGCGDGEVAVEQHRGDRIAGLEVFVDVVPTGDGSTRNASRAAWHGDESHLVEILSESRNRFRCEARHRQRNGDRPRAARGIHLFGAE